MCLNLRFPTLLSHFPTPRFLQSVGMHNTKVIAKIETRQALLNFQVSACQDGWAACVKAAGGKGKPTS